MTRLNARQNEAVRYIDGPLLVLAGAGSGKTSVITRKIAYLIEQCGIDARHIAAVTFTNKAAREMKERVGKLVRGKAAEGLTVSTFHTLGLNIIRSEHRRLGFKRGFSILDAEDALSVVRDILVNENTATDQAQLIRNLISDWKNAMVGPSEAVSMAESDGEYRAASAYGSYQRLLAAYNAVDFDDLIWLPVKLFNDDAEVAQKWRSRIRHLLVDEYQDTNAAQYELVKLLVDGRNGLTAVGDDDQSIYAWRGARPENLAQLQSDFPLLKVVKLEQNYRSTVRILGAANAVIANNPHVFEKQLWSELGHGEPIRVLCCADDAAEIERIVTEIIDQKLQSARRFSDFAVLYRGNYQSRALEIVLQQHQVPYRISGGTSFFARNEVKDIMAYLRLLLNPDDDNAFLRVVNTPRRKIGPTTLEALGTYANQRHVSLYSAAGELGLAERLGERGIAKLAEFTRWLDHIREQCERDDPIRAIREMIGDMDYEGWLHQNASNDRVAERRMANVGVLIDSLAKSLGEDDDDIQAAISKLVLRDLMEQREEEEAGDQVQLMTLHAAKGLEFPHVFIMGVEENLLPHRASIDEDNIEEERRLFYVGITRAQRSLTLTFCRQRRQFGETVDCLPSRFIDELPGDDLLREGFGESSPEQVEAKGHSTIASLKGLLQDL